MAFLPGWNSLESATRYHRFFEIAGIACLAAVVVTEVLALLYGNRKDQLVEIQTGEKLSQLQGVVSAGETRFADSTSKNQALKSDLDKLKRESEKQRIESLPRTLTDSQKSDFRAKPRGKL